MTTLCICGIDTGIGKSVVTGLLARFLDEQGHSVITQKPIQTGCDGPSEDILTHRRLMETGWLEEDEQRLTCPYTFSLPGSPHLAARHDGMTVDLETITTTTRMLEKKYEWVLIEGAGGLMVPMTEDTLFIDYLEQQSYPLLLVTSPRLGSINHTLMSLEMIRSRGLKLAGLVYNLFDTARREVVKDSQQIFTRELEKRGYGDTLVVLPKWPDHLGVEWEKITTNIT